MKPIKCLVLFFLLFLLMESSSCDSKQNDTPVPQNELPIVPPFSNSNTKQLNDIINPQDPTTFIGLRYKGQESKSILDVRFGRATNMNPYLFDAIFQNGLIIEIRVNPEFSDQIVAEEQAEKYARILGRVPLGALGYVNFINIHAGEYGLFAWNQEILIYKGSGENHIVNESIEEVMVHEAAHVAFDNLYRHESSWNSAQDSDPTFISRYAHDFPEREDLAESFPFYIAYRFRQERISNEVLEAIEKAIPNRILFFDGLGINMDPIDR